MLCGDFNAVPDAEEIRMLTGLTTVPVAKLVFIDVTWASTNMVRRYGRCPKGQRRVCPVPPCTS